MRVEVDVPWTVRPNEPSGFHGRKRIIEPCFGIGHNLSLICQLTSEDIKHQLIISGLLAEGTFIFSIARVLRGRVFKFKKPVTLNLQSTQTGELCERHTEHPHPISSSLEYTFAVGLFLSANIVLKCKHSSR